MPGNIHSPTPKLKEGTFVLDPHFFESFPPPPPPPPLEFHTIMIRGQWRIQGKGPGGPPPLLLDENEAGRAEKNFLEAAPPPPPYLRVWMTAPPPAPYLEVWIHHWEFQ